MIVSEDALAGLPDYPALAHLASALWNDGEMRGAAILVGAGFSRNAKMAGNDTRRPPLWQDLRDAMADELYHGRVQDAPKDALRLAEEYRVYHGPAALIDFMRAQIPDASWIPGQRHKNLLALPWADILTTNFDTLLERALGHDRVVQNAADLARVRSPRVIKLHGSINANTRLIITEEDYRTYPSRSAAFVNTARQIFLENELCLLGFSGDDPNFLQWSGWVRDHLGENARRIYLVGSLGLSPAKRRLLESRNVAPIDFARLTEGLDREQAQIKATDLFLSYLHSKKPRSPSDWQPADWKSYDFIPKDVQTIRAQMADPTASASLLERLSTLWQTDKDTCPDWLIIPRTKRMDLAFSTKQAPWNYVRVLPFLSLGLRATLLLQAVWRSVAALESIENDVWIAAVATAGTENELQSSERVFLLCMLLNDARHNRDEVRFKQIEAMLASATASGSDAHAHLVAQRLLWARDGLDYLAVSAGAAALDGPDPIWRILKAALCCECGEADVARPLLTDALSDLADRQRRDPRSISVASRLEWANVFRRALRLPQHSLPERNVSVSWLNTKYDAWDEIDKIRQEIRSEYKRRSEEPQGYQPKFGLGAYQDHGRTIHFSSSAPGHAADTVFRLADAACLPLRVEDSDLIASLACDALDGDPLPTLSWHLRLLRAVMSHSSPIIERHFSSIAVAKLEAKTAAELIERVVAATRFWQQRTRQETKSSFIFAVQRLRVLIEVLSRLIVRGEPSVALSAFHLGCDIASDPNKVHYWLYEPIGNLLTWSVNALPPEQRNQVVIECLEFPLPPEDGPATDRWPEPAGRLFAYGTPPERPPGDARWRACVAQLLAGADRPGRSRGQAVHRLAYLDSHGCLDEQERAEFGRLLWASTDPKKNNLPLDVDLFPNVIAHLPQPAAIDALSRARAYLFGGSVDTDNIEGRLSCIAFAATRTSALKMLPLRSEAVVLMEEFLKLLALPLNTDDPFADQIRKRLLDGVAEAVGSAILPVLQAEDLTPQRDEFIDRCARLGNGGGTLAGLYELTRVSHARIGQVSATLRRALRRGDLLDVVGAARSIRQWAEAAQIGRCPPVPETLKDAVIAAIEVGVRPGLQMCIWCVRHLLRLQVLSPDQIEAILAVLKDFQTDLAYDQMPQTGPVAIGITGARAECVRLADAMLAAGYSVDGWTVGLDNDPLPEVRFALSEVD